MENMQKDKIKNFSYSTIVREIIKILENHDISYIEEYAGRSVNKKLAIEFVRCHAQFLTQLVQNDLFKNIERSPAEIIDLVENVNFMLRKKESAIFDALVDNCVRHYRYFYKKELKKHGKPKRIEDHQAN